MNKQHHYQVAINWQSDTGTTGYKNYSRDHEIAVSNKPKIACSSDPSFLGDTTKYNPEELFLSSISSCHLLWYLHLCAANKIVVLSYEDHASGIMEEYEDGSGRFTEITLHPRVMVLSTTMIPLAEKLHDKANQYCFIANSLNFAVHHKPIIISKEN